MSITGPLISQRLLLAYVLAYDDGLKRTMLVAVVRPPYRLLKIAEGIYASLPIRICIQ